MTKQELAHIAKVMYDLQEYCKSLEIRLSCSGCPCVELKNVRLCMLYDEGKLPNDWEISQADIERLERESNENR